MTVATVGAYRANQVTTISRGQLLLLAYDGILRFIEEARLAMTEERYEAKNTNLKKAQDLIQELNCALEPSIFPELASNLTRLYQYMYDRLIVANVQDDTAALREVASMVSDLRAAWAEAERQTRGYEG